MADDPDRADPNGTLDTVPPPKGAKDAYSAPTRVGTLPEHVLEAMREQVPDAAVLSRTSSEMRAAARSPLVPPPLPTSLDVPSLVPELVPLHGVRAHEPTPESLAWSLVVVAVFALLGALVATAIMFAGR